MAGKLSRFLEGLVLLAILLVLVQTFLEDYALIAGWSWPVRRTLILTGLGFDIFFTLEFLIRFYGALIHRRALHYISRERGWVDLLASVPLLLFNSGPAVAAIYLGGAASGGMAGMLNVLKVAKAIRVTRVLRLLRVLKIFKRILYASSSMAQRHAAKIATIAVTTMVFVLLGWTLAEGSLPGLTTREWTAAHRAAAAERLQVAGRVSSLRTMAQQEPDLLLVKSGGKTLYSRYSNEEYRNNFGPEDYLVMHRGNFSFFFSLLPQRAEYAGTNMLFFLLIIAVVVVLLLYYAPHFALTVSDPIHIMRRGLAESSYDLEVRIPGEYARDDVYRLARLYNEQYLPMKKRAQAQEHERRITDLKVEDVLGR